MGITLRLMLGEKVCEDVRWMEPAQDSVQWQALVLVVLNLWVVTKELVWLVGCYSADLFGKYFSIFVEQACSSFTIYSTWQEERYIHQKNKIYEE